MSNGNVLIIFCIKVPKADEEYDLRVPRDMAYIFSGAYIPLSCKLIEQVSQPGHIESVDKMGGAAMVTLK